MTSCLQIRTKNKKTRPYPYPNSQLIRFWWWTGDLDHEVDTGILKRIFLVLRNRSSSKNLASNSINNNYNV